MQMYNIALICDDGYALPTAVCIKSIIDTADYKDVKFIFHVCTFGLSENNRKLFAGLQTPNANIFVHIFDKHAVEEKLSGIVQKSHVTPTALIKFELPNYFNELERLLYLDSDIVAIKNISDIFNVDISDRYIAASYEFWKYLDETQYKWIPDKKFYFNSGVMLLNLKKMREDGIVDKLWDYKLNKAQTTLMDQESFNAVCGAMALPLPIKWNFNPAFAEEVYVRGINKVYGSYYVSVQSMLDDVRLIHYVGKTDKPWIYESARMQKYWQNYFDSLKLGFPLQLKELHECKRPIAVAAGEKIKEYGIIGFSRFVYYRLKQKLCFHERKSK